MEIVVEHVHLPIRLAAENLKAVRSQESRFPGTRFSNSSQEYSQGALREIGPTKDSSSSYITHRR